MNEVTKIHLGRTAFVVAVDAHHDLRQYLAAIKKHVGSKHAEVLEEVELRMAELLAEKGIAGDKVVVAKDVAYLKEQLGKPSDFEDEGPAADDEPAADEQQPRRLFRDPRDQIVGGVASGIGAYFGIDAWIVRLIFLGLFFAGGGGFVFYLLLWALIPKAQSKADFLQMTGQPVTAKAIADYIDRQDLAGDARRFSYRVGRFLAEIGRLTATALRGGAGVFLTVVSLVSIILTVGTGIFVLTSPEKLSGAGRLFPVGPVETTLVFLVMAVLLSASALLLGAGIAFLRKKWPLPVWASGALAAILVAGTAVSLGLGARTAPKVQDRYKATERTTTRQVAAFTQLDVRGDNAIVTYEYADTPSVDIRTVGSAQDKSVVSAVKDGTLQLSVGDIRKRDCDWLCIPVQEVYVTVKAPRLDKITVHQNADFTMDVTKSQEKFTLVVSDSADISITSLHAKQATYRESGYSAAGNHAGPVERTLELRGITVGAANDYIWSHQYTALHVSGVDDLQAIVQRVCDRYDPSVSLGPGTTPSKLSVNGQPFETAQALSQKQSDQTHLTLNCVAVET
jgi:phage shock protein PspC (stress-responsive transcriptional regulator)